MAVTNDWGQGQKQNSIDWGQGATDNTIDWGKSQTLSPGGETNISGASGFTNTLSTRFDGIDDFVSVADSASLSFGNGTTDSPFSLSSWWNMASSISFRAINKVGTTANTSEYRLNTVNGKKLKFTLYDTNSSTLGLVSNVDLSSFENTWINVLATYDGSGSSSGLKVYINGSILATSSNNTGSYVSMHNTSADFLIGKSNFSGVLNPAQGAIDEVAVFNTELSASAVTTIYNSGAPNDLNGTSGLVSWWRMGDGDTFPTITDNQGSNNGTMTNMSAGNFITNVPTQPFSIKSIALDGVDDFVGCGDSDSLSFGNGTTDSPFSISAWVNMADATRFRVVNKGANFSNDYEYIFATGNTDILVFNLYDSSTGARIARKYDTALTSFQGQWIHLVATYNGNETSGGIKIYLNGSRVDDASNDTGSYTAMENGTNPFELGASTSGGNYSNGALDEVAVFNTELSASNVTTIYNSGLPNDISSLSPVSWWRCGDGDTAPTLTDNGSASNNGTMTNFSTFSTNVPT